MNATQKQSPAGTEKDSLDKKPIEEGSQESAVFDFATGTLEQFDELVINGEDLKSRDEWLNAEPDDPKFKRINDLLNDREAGKYTPPEPEGKPAETGGKPDEGKGGEGTEGEAETSSETGTDEEVETVAIGDFQIPKDLLGTFLNGHTVEEAVKLALEARINGQNFIDEIKPKHNQLQDTTANLRQQLIETQQKLEGLERAAKEHGAAQSVEVKPFAVPEIEEVDLDDLDAYDPAAMEEFIKKLKGVKGKIVDYNKEVLSQQQKKPESKQPEGSGGGAVPEKNAPVSKAVQEQVDALYQASIDRELDEISDLQRAIPALRTTIKFSELDNQVTAFQSGIAAAAGMNPNSVDDMLKATRTYYSQTAEGEQLREMCKVRGVNPPKEIDKWSEVMKFRKVRNANIADRAREIEDEIFHSTGQKVSKQLHQIKPIAGNTYLDLYQKANPIDVNKIALEATVKGHQNAARNAAAFSQSHVAEPGEGVGHQENFIGYETEKGQVDLVSKYRDHPNSITQDEAKMLLSWCNEGGIPPPDDLLKRAKG